jgi:predicted membrane channel-forming protein YqfA (hemolysin III family)
MPPKPKTILILLSIVLLVLLIPFVAMQFTNEVNWSVMDFVMAGILLFGTSLVIELVIRKVKSNKHRILISGIILLLLFLLWAELAVGIFGSPIAGN